MAQLMNIKNGYEMLSKNLHSVFQEHNRDIFQFKSSEIIEIYKQKISVDEDLEDDLQENISSDEFQAFVQTVIDLCLHMVLSDPQISIPWKNGQGSLINQFDFWEFTKAEYFCIDGFPTEGMPGVVIVPAPLRGNYVYQGLKPAVIVLSKDCIEELEEG